MPGRVVWRDVIVFALIAFGLTWSWDAIWIAPRLGDLLSAPTTPTDPTAVFGNTLYHLPAMFGPLLAAVAMRVWISREGIRGSLTLRQSWAAYAVAAAAPVALVGAVAVVLVSGGFARLVPPPPAEPFTIAVWVLLPTLLLFESVLGLGEEYGWRGYLLPRLMPLGEVTATLVLGTVWWCWHLPVLVAGVILGGHPLWLIVPIHLGLVVLGSFPYTWLGRATGCSPVLAAIFHGSTNWAQQRFLTFLVLANLLVGVAAIAFAWLLVILIVYGFRLWRAHSRPI